MKKQNNECKEHTDLINQLVNENNKLKQKNEKLMKQNQTLLNKYHKLKHAYTQIQAKNQQININVKQARLTGINQNRNIGLPNRLSANIIEPLQTDHFNQILKTSQIKSQEVISSNQNAFERTPPRQMKPPTLRSSRSSSRHSSLIQKFFPLIQGCFIIQKKKCFTEKSKTSLSQMTEFIYPQQLVKTQKQTLQMMLKYTFTQPQITKYYDDQFNSRQNQIIFGTPYQDFTYAFQDGKWASKKQLPEIMKLMGTMKKKYYHILVKPQIIQKQQIQIQQIKKQNEQNKQQQQQKQKIAEQQKTQYFYQTEVIFGFISPFPLRSFFQDLHRTIQQQLKFSQFSIDEHKQQVYNPTGNRKNKYRTVSKIMRQIYQQQYKINKFPINKKYSTGIATLQLSIPTVVSYRQMDDQFLTLMLMRYNATKVCKLLHYVLAQKCILIQADDAKSLNQIFEMIRIMIRPFLWIFAVVYMYSDYFQPFMSSPMPIIIGKVQQKEKLQQGSQSSSSLKTPSPKKDRSSVDYSEFCYVKMDNVQQQVKQPQLYSKLIKKLKRQLEKCDKKQQKTAIIHNYVYVLRVFIQKGILNSQPTDFHVQFMDTQMVAYFKQTKEQ